MRVPNSIDRITSNSAPVQNNNILFNAIEKELLKEGFSVRDRGLFNEIMDKSHTTDYTKIGEETDTDLILEVVNINTDVTYPTNRITVIKKSRTESKIQQNDYKRRGASIEFRLIL